MRIQMLQQIPIGLLQGFQFLRELEQTIWLHATILNKQLVEIC